jgi:hypothetical protein
MTDVMQAIAARASANPAYTQPIRIPQSQPQLSQFHRTCRTLAVFIWGVTAGVLLQMALQHYFPTAYASTTSQRAPR